MDTSHIELPGSRIASTTRSGSGLTVVFAPAVIIKRMTGSKERTRWRQGGSLLFEGVEGQPERPAGPLMCTGGEIDENLYTYRDMIPIPFVSRGQIRCLLHLEGQDQPLLVEATAVRLELEGVAKYLEHLRV